MSEFTIYGVPGSPYLRSALLVLEEKQAHYTLIKMAPPATKQPEHLARHPFGRIPVLEHDDFRLYETQAILRYVDAVCPGISLQPADPRSAARLNQIIGITDWYFFRDVSATIGFNRIVAPAFGMATDENVVLAAIPKAAICLKALSELIGGAPYVAGDGISIADLMLAPQMEFLAMTPEGVTLLEPYPHLKAWLASMQERPSMQATTWKKLT